MCNQSTFVLDGEHLNQLLGARPLWSASTKQAPALLAVCIRYSRIQLLTVLSRACSRFSCKPVGPYK